MPILKKNVLNSECLSQSRGPFAPLSFTITYKSLNCLDHAASTTSRTCPGWRTWHRSRHDGCRRLYGGVRRLYASSSSWSFESAAVVCLWLLAKSKRCARVRTHHPRELDTQCELQGHTRAIRPHCARLSWHHTLATIRFRPSTRSAEPGGKTVAKGRSCNFSRSLEGSPPALQPHACSPRNTLRHLTDKPRKTTVRTS